MAVVKSALADSDSADNGSTKFSAMYDAESNHENILSEETARVIDSMAERAYFFNALDKGDLGNAETAGLSESKADDFQNSHHDVLARSVLPPVHELTVVYDTDLGFAPGQYNLILGIFFLPYVVFAPPVAMLGKKFGPARVLPMCYEPTVLTG